jgi:hypothetical protein
MKNTSKILSVYHSLYISLSCYRKHRKVFGPIYLLFEIILEKYNKDYLIFDKKYQIFFLYLL